MTRIYLLPIVEGAKRFGFAVDGVQDKFERGTAHATRSDLGTLLARYHGERVTVIAAYIPEATCVLSMALVKEMAPAVNLIPLQTKHLKHWVKALDMIVDTIGLSKFRSAEMDAFWVDRLPIVCLHGIDPSDGEYGCAT